MVKDPWTKRRKPRKRTPMSKTIGTQTSPQKFLPTHWDPKVIIQQLKIAQMDKIHADLNHASNADSEECDTVIRQYKDVPKLVSRLPNNYNIFVKPITNNEKANSTLASGLMSNLDSQQSLQYQNLERSACIQRDSNVAKRYKPGPKCYKRLHEQFHAEFDIPLMRDADNSNNSLNDSLTVIHEQEEEVIEPPQQMSLTSCIIEKDNEVEVILDASSANCNISDPIEITGLTALLENASGALIDETNQDMVETHSPAREPISKETEKQQSIKEPTENTGENTRPRNKTVTFEFRDIRTEIVENDGNERPTAPNEENDSMEDEEDIGHPMRKRKYIRIFAEKVNIYNHFYN